MGAEGLQCHGCGSTNVEFDPRARKLICNTCGKEEFYSRATLNANGKVLFSKQNAVNFFKEGKVEDAHHYAREILNISMDNAPALFIMAYYEEFVVRRPNAMKNFFYQIKDVALEYEEVQDLKQLLIASAYRMKDYEADMIQVVAVNLQAAEDAANLRDFIDQICPYLISKQTSIAFFTKELIEMYGELAEHCTIPKTCFALLKSIETNPESPYVNNSFYLSAKTEYFYENYILPIGSVLKEINNKEIRDKFVNAYESKRKQYLEDSKRKGV